MRGLALGAVMLTAIALLAGCGQVVTGKPRASFGDVNPGEVAGLPVTDGPSGLRPGAPAARLPVLHNAHTESDLLAVDTLSDVYDYWHQEMPAAFGRQFQPPRKLVSYDSDGAAVKVCGASSKGVVNAMYCPTENSVNWDRGQLLPFLIKQFGPLAVVTVLAHEMGHDVQFQLGKINKYTPSIVLEQQADCYAGGFIRWAAQGNAKHFQISTGPGLNAVMSALFLVRDRLGAHSYHSANAHGSAFDRIYAFQAGFSEGPKRCAKIDLAEIKDRPTERIFNSDEQHQDNGNLPINDQTVALLQRSLDEAFGQDSGPGPRIVSNDGTCADGTGTPPASYCPADNTVAIDMPKLSAIATLPTKKSVTSGNPNSPGGIGDFAAFAEIASRYALGVEHKLKIPLDDNQAGLRTACLTGAWTGVTRNPVSAGSNLLLASGDLDEAVAELLTARSIISADVYGRDVPSGFARVEAFRIGFIQGSDDCTKKFR
ncbi:MAG: neutral zinc metallopeptidase [Sciscionella sp.]